MARPIILVIDADDDPVYQTGRALWRANAGRHGAQVFFLRSVREISDDRVYVDGDCLFTRWFDGFEHSLNDKTLKAFQYCHEYLDFDFVLRTNLSSFYRLDALDAFLQGAPRQNFYAGPLNVLPIEDGGGEVFEYISGSGILLSRDLLPVILSKRHRISLDQVDDIWTGIALPGVPRQALPRCDFTDIDSLGPENIFKILARIEEADRRGDFHFRVKNSGKLPRYALDALVFGMLAQKYLA